MSIDEEEGFAGPNSPPPPFKLSEADRIATRKRQALFLRQSLRIVERFGRNPITPSMLEAALPWLEREQYDDIAVERNAYGNCGYVLCTAPRGEIVKQQYRICPRTQRVFDTTRRRPFCSDWCFRASYHVRKQISKEPNWCRSADHLSINKFTLLPRDAPGLPGKLVLDVVNRLKYLDDDSSDACSTASETDERELDDNAGDYLAESPENNEALDISCSKLSDMYLNTEDKKCDTNNLDSVNNSNSQLSVQLVDRLDSNKLVAGVTSRLREWLTKEALQSLTGQPESRMKSDLIESRLVSKIMKQYYSCYDTSVDRTSLPHLGVNSTLGVTVMPLMDSVSPNVLRRQILLNSLKDSMKTCLNFLNVEFQPIYQRLGTVVDHLDLNKNNVHLNCTEGNLMALSLLRLMAQTEPSLCKLLDGSYLTHILKSINGPNLTVFNNVLINPALKMFSLDSDDELSADETD